MSNIQIPNLPVAIALNGTEEMEIVQSGVSVRATTQLIAELGLGPTGPTGPTSSNIPTTSRAPAKKQPTASQMAKITVSIKVASANTKLGKLSSKSISQIDFSILDDDAEVLLLV